MSEGAKRIFIVMFFSVMGAFMGYAFGPRRASEVRWYWEDGNYDTFQLRSGECLSLSHDEQGYTLMTCKNREEKLKVRP